MPSHLPSSFASAAAGQTNRDTRGGTGDGRGSSGEWSRRDGRSTNGTRTFRRPSTTPQGQQSQTTAESPIATLSDPPSASQSLAYDQPPRFGKDQILELFKSATIDSSQSEIPRLYMPNWNPGHVNGHASRGWGKSNEAGMAQERDACWAVGKGENHPVFLAPLTAEEKEVLASDVNSPIKPPSQNKESGQGSGPNGRKASLSHGSGGAYSLASPTSTRPGNRRRESIEPNPFTANLASPTASRFSREDQSPWFSRKSMDPKEMDMEDDGIDALAARDQANAKAPFSGLMRSNTSGSTGGLGFMWPPNSASASGGSFGNFSLPTPTSTGNKQFGARGESRLAHLLPPKESSESLPGKSSETANPDINKSWRPRPRTDTDPFGDDSLGGSGMLTGIRDASSPPPIPRTITHNIGFDASARSAADPSMLSLHMGPSDPDPAPVSPSATNPFGSSPPREGADDDGSTHRSQGFGFSSDQGIPFSTAARAFAGNAFDGSDRSQTSSAGPKAYPPLSSLGGWPAVGGPSAGTPDRERGGFGGGFSGSLFNHLGDLQSAGLGTFGQPSSGAIGSASTIGRRRKLESLFPPAMQAQMQGQDHEPMGDSMPDMRQNNTLAAIGRGSFGSLTREQETQMRSGRNTFDDLYAPSDPARSQGPFGSADSQLPGVAMPQAQGGPGTAFGTIQPPPADPASAQARQMVMPDRMRWVYQDPQGKTQGPFTGLEMNDWYKANFFTPDLQVRKLEDPEFEPLGGLIRRIGNSREPFLVPQIGIPHGEPSQTGPFSPSVAGGVIPPLSGVFPSFGRTLTAEEQNNLERRKQEEQYAAAQQREFAMRQHVAKFGMPVPGSLHHHSSAHSLQSQPSFGSMTSPIGVHPQAPIGPVPQAATGFFQSPPAPIAPAPANQAPGPEMFRDTDLANLTEAEVHMLTSMHVPGGLSAFPHAAIPPTDLGGPMRAQLPGTDELTEDELGFRDRLKQFEELRSQPDEDAFQVIAVGQASIGGSGMSTSSRIDSRRVSKDSDMLEDEPAGLARDIHDLSLEQQLQHTRAAPSGLPMPFPPPHRDEIESPELLPAHPVQPPPLAPWAKDAGGQQKGPSLKEIQESEARKAAKAEQVAAAARRRAAYEQEVAELREREKVAATGAPGLPTTSTWGQASPISATSPWTKPKQSKGAPGIPTPVAQNERKKTLAEIQREEEARKVKAREATVQVVSASIPAAGGKRYAELASRPNAPPLQQPNTTAGSSSGWATVGAGGKVKIPTGPAAQIRSLSSANVKSGASKPQPKLPMAGTAVGKVEGSAAMEEFSKWVRRELGRGITAGIDIESFAATLVQLPLDPTLISDAVYANSTTMDGRHFAEEFIRRKKLADKGIIEKQPAATPSEIKPGNSGGGWSEVAKKGSHVPSKEAETITGAGFKMVSGRKKPSKK